MYIIYQYYQTQLFFKNKISSSSYNTSTYAYVCGYLYITQLHTQYIMYALHSLKLLNSATYVKPWRLASYPPDQKVSLPHQIAVTVNSFSCLNLDFSVPISLSLLVGTSSKHIYLCSLVFLSLPPYQPLEFLSTSLLHSLIPYYNAYQKLSLLPIICDYFCS